MLNGVISSNFRTILRNYRGKLHLQSNQFAGLKADLMFAATGESRDDLILIYVRTTCSSSLGEEETGWSGGWSARLAPAGHLSPVDFFFFLGSVSGLLNGGSEPVSLD